MYLKFYRTEWDVYHDFWQVRYTPAEADKVLRKLSRHFKVKCYWEFTKYKNGNASYIWNTIKLPKQNIALAMIIHELGHLLAMKKYQHIGHNKYLKRANKIIFRYAIKFLPIEILYRTNNQLLLEYRED